MTRTSPKTKWLVLATVCFALFMINLDGNVVNLAMPTIVREYKATLSQLEWISNAYLLTFAVFLITLGRLGDQLGRKRLFLGGLAAFTVGSALCGSAQDVAQLIAFRIIQGIGGSAMMPATLSLITANFAKEERGRAMGFWGGVTGLAFIMGPILGGYLTQFGLGPALNSLLGVRDLWRYVFYINVPFGILAFVFGLVVVPESRDAGASHRLDYVGVILASLAVLFLAYGFVEGPRYGWWGSVRPLTLAGIQLHPFGLSVVPFLFALCAILGTAFILYEKRRREEPLVDLSLFANRNYSVGMVIGVVLNFALMGAVFLVPLYCQTVLGIDPTHTGTLMLPFAAALLVTSPLAGILSDRLGGKYVMIGGLALWALSCLLMARFRVDTRASEMIVPFIFMGLGMGLSMTPLTNLTLYGVSPSKAGGASGVISTMRQLGAVMGIAIFSVALQTSMVGSIRIHAAEVPHLPPAAQKVLVDYVAGGGLYGGGDGQAALTSKLTAAMMPAAGAHVSAPSADVLRQIGAGIDRAMKAAFTESINVSFILAALIGAGAVLIALFVQGARKRPVLATVGAEAPSGAAAEVTADSTEAEAEAVGE